MINVPVVMIMKTHLGVKFEHVVMKKNIHLVPAVVSIRIRMIVKNLTILYRKFLDLYFSLTERNVSKKLKNLE